MKSAALAIVLLAVLFGCGPTSPAAPSNPKAAPTDTATPIPTPIHTPTKVPVGEMSNAASRVLYDDLVRRNEAHIGEAVYYQAYIHQAVPAPDGKVLYRAAISLGGRRYCDDVALLSVPGERLIQGDLLEIIATVQGMGGYESILGVNVITPVLVVRQTNLLLTAKQGSGCYDRNLGRLRQ